MANHIVYVDAEVIVDDDDFGSTLDPFLTVSPATTSVNPIVLRRNDTLTIKYRSYTNPSSSSVESVSISSFSSSIFLTSSNESLTYVNDTIVRTANGNNLHNTLDAITVSWAGETKTIYVKGFDPDVSPDAFSFGAYVNQAELASYYYTDTVTLTGFDAETTLTAFFSTVENNNGVAVRVNGGVWASAVNVRLNDKIQLRIKSANTYTTMTVAVIKVGNLSVAYRVTTKYPSSQHNIPLGVTSGPIKLSDLKRVFNYSLPQHLSYYARGNVNVPDLYANRHVSTSGPLSLKSFYGSANVLKFSQPPTQKQTTVVNTSSSTKTGSLNFLQGLDFTLDHNHRDENLEIMFTLTQEQGSLSSTRLTNFTSSLTITPTFNAWHSLTNAKRLVLTKTQVGNSAYVCRGFIGVKIRHIQHRNLVVDENARYHIEFTT